MAKSMMPWVVLLGLAISITVGGSAYANPQGMWLTEGGKSHVKIEPCGEKLCGAIVWLKEPNNDDGSAKLDINNENDSLRDRPIVGLRMLTNFVEKGAGKWDSGKIYNPEDGKTYSSKIEIADPKTLKVSGCVFIFCKTQTWTRVE